MKLNVEWVRPIALKNGSRENLIYAIDLMKVPDVSGVYVFGRRWGRGFEALYVGKANSIRGRVKSRFNNLRLMNHLKNAKIGKRVVLARRVDTKPGQRLPKCMVLIERTLIRYFLLEGHDLVNRQGTRIRRHEVMSSGKHPKSAIAGVMYLERAKGE